MDHRAGFLTYLLATGGSILGAVALTTSFGISGYADVALTLGMLIGAVYLVTPADERGEAKRLFGIVALAMGAFMAGSGVGVLAGVGVAPREILDAPAEASRAGLTFKIMAISIGVAACVYTALFAAGWRYAAPQRRREAATDEPADWAKRLF
ncbi:MAG: hypothetical protein AB7O04_03555 [Hyphomonadaceae bacterium]